MADQAITLSSDSQNPIAPLSCSENERPPVILTYAALHAIDDERYRALNAWTKHTIPTGRGRVAALKKDAVLKRRYEQLIGHPAGRPDLPLPMDALPHIDIKKS